MSTYTAMTAGKDRHLIFNFNQNRKEPMKRFILIAPLFILSACSEEASFDTVENSRAIANENSRFTATKWRAENGFEKLSILARGDSTQSAKCPQGDGWASVDLLNPETKAEVIKLKCSTVSANIGCIKSEDFKSRTNLVSQENECNKEIPSQIPKIER